MHSYEFKPEKKTDTLGKTDYGKTFVAAVEEETALACNFIPKEPEIRKEVINKLPLHGIM